MVQHNKETYVFSLIITKIKISPNIFIYDKEDLYFILFDFFLLNQYFVINSWLHFTIIKPLNKTVNINRY